MQAMQGLAFILLLLVISGCSIEDEDRCMKGYVYDPDNEVCIKDVDAAEDDGADGAVDSSVDDVIDATGPGDGNGDEQITPIEDSDDAS